MMPHRPQRFGSLLLVCLLGLLPDWLPAQPRGNGHSVTSRSRQFTVSHSLTRPTLQPATPLGKMPEQVQLTQAKLVLFAEDLRGQLLMLLKIPAQAPWTGRIHLNIVPGKADDPIVVQRRRFTDRWTYRLDLPEIMRSTTLARTLVAVLLEEIAARETQQVPPLPAWLSEGLAESILKTRGPVLFSAFQNIAGGVSNHQMTHDPLATARQVLKDATPLTFLHLTLPPVQYQNAQGRQMLRAYAQLLVHKILHRKTGPAALRTFLTELPRHRNSQHAFMAAMGFKSMLQTEQWWSVAQVQFRSRDALNRWYPNIALEHLDNALNIPVTEIDEFTEEPRTVFVPLAKFMREASAEAQRTQLTALMQQLLVIQLNAPPKVARLIEDYRATLRLYLGPPPTANRPVAAQFNRTLRDQCIVQLTRLDVIQRDLKSVAQQEIDRAKHVPEDKTPENPRN